MDPQFVEIVMNGTATARGGEAKPIANVYHFYRTSGIPVRVKANVDAAFNTAIIAPVLAALSVDFTQSNNSVRWIDDATDAPITFPHAGVGLVTGDRAPDHVCVTIQFKTGVRGLASRGSKHYGPISEDSTTGDCLKAPDVILFDAVKSAVLAGFTDTDGNVWQPVVISTAVTPVSPPDFSHNPTFFRWAVITSGLLNKSLGSMRRRKIKTVN